MENVKVSARLRPLNEWEASLGEELTWAVEGDCSIAATQKEKSGRRIAARGGSRFSFDHCFDVPASNQNVFEHVVRPLIISALDGINCSVLMYGQTGSGKTFTMLGTQFDKRFELNSEGSLRSSDCSRINARDEDASNEFGVLTYGVRELLKRIEQDEKRAYFLSCSYVEIYNEAIFDLLRPRDQLSEALSVNVDSKDDFYIKGVIEESVGSLEKICELLYRGEANRHFAETNMNHTSSRSHALFRLNVRSVVHPSVLNKRKEDKRIGINDPELRALLARTDREAIVAEASINFVDLAGSERLALEAVDETLPSLLSYIRHHCE